MNNENKKWIIISFLALSAIVWYVTEKILFGIVDLLGITVYSLLGDFTVLSAGAVIPALGLFFYFQRNSRNVGFTNEVILGLKKIVWPPRKETTASTVIVLVLVFIAASILGIFDFFWIKILRLFL
jgi:preprotein translocase subunit SecE